MLQASRFTISLITHFEVLRGLLAIRATRRLANYQVLPLTEGIVDRAAEVYADLRAAAS